MGIQHRQEIKKVVFTDNLYFFDPPLFDRR